MQSCICIRRIWLENFLHNSRRAGALLPPNVPSLAIEQYQVHVYLMRAMTIVFRLDPARKFLVTDTKLVLYLFAHSSPRVAHVH